MPVNPEPARQEPSTSRRALPPARLALLLFLLLFTVVNIYLAVILVRRLFFPELAVVQDVSQEFTTYVKTLNEVNHLTLARLQTWEFMEKRFRKEVKVPEWDWLRGLLETEAVGSEAVIEVICPVTYSFYVDLNDPDWAVHISGSLAYVDAPPIRWEEPAIDTQGLKTYVDGGYLIFKEEKKRAEALRNLTRQLQPLAAAHARQTRENCRHSLQEFVRKWLSAQQQQLHAVLVRFPDEPAHAPGAASPAE